MIFTIFKKELIDTLRDRRTVLMMFIIPTLIFPVVLNLMTRVSSSFEEKVAEKTLKIGIVNGQIADLDAQLASLPEVLGKKTLIPFADSTSLIEYLQKDSIDVGLFIPLTAKSNKEELKPLPVTIFHNGTDLGIKERAEALLNVVDESWKKARYAKLNINEQQITPMEISERNTASNKEMIGKLAGGFLPYMFIAFGFMGCMFPAIDLFTGEKERGTIETLLTTPVARWKILFGKMGVVVLSGLMASTFNLLGLVLSLEVFDLVKDPEILKAINDILSPAFIFMLYLLLFPLIVFFAGIMIPIAVRAKSFKEAQSIISPLNVAVIFPAMVGLLPGIELNTITALIPIVNIVLATKELIAGTLEWHLVAISFGVMVTLATLAVFLSYRKFEGESNVIA